MNVRLMSAADEGLWDAYVMGSGASNCYHLTGWKNVIERTFGKSKKTFYLLAEGPGAGAGPGKLEGILPLVRLKSILFGNYLVSMPYFNYGGICAETPAAERELLDAAIKIASDEGADHVEMRHTRPMDLGLEEKMAKVSMRLALPETPGELWKSFPSKLRNQIGRPAKEGMTVRAGGREELAGFYHVFSANMRDLGTPVYPRDFFRNILDEFPGRAWIITVRSREGLPVASGFFAGFKDTVEIPWASSLRSHNRYGPNMLLYWTGLETACEKGFKVFDFGRSTPGEGTYRFKEQWGARPIQLHWHYWLKDGGPLPEINKENPKYRMSIKVWQKLPVSLTRLIGPAISGDLPW